MTKLQMGRLAIIIRVSRVYLRQSKVVVVVVVVLVVVVEAAEAS